MYTFQAVSFVKVLSTRQHQRSHLLACKAAEAPHVNMQFRIMLLDVRKETALVWSQS